MRNKFEIFKNKRIDYESKNSDIDIINLFQKIFYNLSKKRKIQLFFLGITIILSALSELFSLAAIIPFLSILVNPEGLWKNKFFYEFATKLLNINYAQDLIIPIAILFFISVLLSAIIRIINLWLNLKLSSLIGVDFSSKAFKKVIYEKYSIHINRNSSLIIQGITKSTAWLVFLIERSLKLVSSLVILIALIIGILFVNQTIAILIFILFGGFYSIFALTVKKRLKLNSFIVSRLSQNQIKLVQEILGSIKDILLEGNQIMHLNDFKLMEFQLRKKIYVNKFISAVPRYILEVIGILFISIIALFYALNNSINDVIPLIGVIALAAQKLLPTLQQIFASWAGIKANASGAKQLIDIIENNHDNEIKVFSNFKREKFIFNELEIKNLNFRYSKDTPMVLKNINLKISKGEKIGFIGSTGSGKSTLIDIIMGLLEPSTGSILLNGVNINRSLEDLINWRLSISHVPQNIYLADKTIAENIALGLSKEEIKYLLLKNASKNAMISEFINSSPRGFRTIVGEQGIKLSGGQKQRIGIARALYKENHFFVFDEATSALDNTTEEKIISNINSLNEVTFIMISHRISTLKICNRIIKIDKGLITYDGSSSIIY